MGLRFLYLFKIFITMKNLICILALSLFFIPFADAQSDPAYVKALKKMFELNGSEETYKAAITQSLNMFKDQFPEDESNFIKEFEGELLNTTFNDLFEMLTPVYAKYLTLEDIEAVIQFYETPVGKKFAKNTPAITQESMQVGQQWGMKIAERITEKMMKEKKD